MKHQSKTGLFLMELILSILFFSICSAICVRLFVQSWQTEQKADALTRASLLCDSMAAVLQSTQTPESLSEYFPSLPAFYDAAWQPCKEEDAVWQLTITQKAADSASVRQAAFSVFRLSAAADSPAVAAQNPFYELYVGY